MTAHPALIEWPEDTSDAAGLALWTSAEIAAATSGRASAPFAVSGVEIDSREVREGDLFFALKGEASDGHRFLEGAFGKGAAGAVKFCRGEIMRLCMADQASHGCLPVIVDFGVNTCNLSHNRAASVCADDQRASNNGSIL